MCAFLSKSPIVSFVGTLAFSESAKAFWWAVCSSAFMLSGVG